MKRKAQPVLSASQQALDQYVQVLQQLEDLSPVPIRNYLSDLRQFIVWCEDCCRERQEERPFIPHAVVPSLLVCYQSYLQTSLCLKPSTVNRTLMSLKWYVVWTRKMWLIQPDPALQIMGHHMLDTTMLSIQGTRQDLQHDVEQIAWT